MLTQPIIEAPPRLTHLQSPRGKEDPINYFLTARNRGGDMRFRAGVHGTSFVIAGINRVYPANQLISGQENDWHSTSAPYFFSVMGYPMGI